MEAVSHEPKAKPGRPPKQEEPKQIDKSAFELLKESGIPVQRAIFHETIIAHDGTPEYAFYAPDPKDPHFKKSRVAYMWFTPHGLIWEANNKRGLVQNVKDIRFF